MFVMLWVLQAAWWVFYQIMLYPRYFSPLRHLPGPTGGSIWMGQYPRISREASGQPAAEWYACNPPVSVEELTNAQDTYGTEQWNNSLSGDV
jgi:hypothetical protein